MVGEIDGGKKGGIKVYQLPYILVNSHGNVKYSTGNIASNIVITIYGVRWLLDLMKMINS